MDNENNLNNNPCEGCSKCCEYIALEIDAPTTEEEIENIKWYLLHKNVKVFITEEEVETEDNDDVPEGTEVEVEVEVEEKWNLQFYTPCKELLPNGLCGKYEQRPNICKEHSIENCEQYGDTSEEIASFTDADEFWRWAQEKYDFIDDNNETI
ncbi:MAG: YkgJ family cysteine cluster protein [Candidatus Woesearchaeota archaeon]